MMSDIIKIFAVFVCSICFDNFVHPEDEKDVVSCSLLKKGLTPLQKQGILAHHNKLRAKVAQGQQKQFESATNIQEMHWDDELADNAQNWLDKCNLIMSPIDERKTEKYDSFGQNIYIENCLSNCEENLPLQRAMNWWYNQLNKPEMNKSIIKTYQHLPGYCQFTQLIWAKTNAIGCGYALLTGNWDHKTYVLLCNYGPSGNYENESVYEEGETGSACAVPSKLYPGLCTSKHCTSPFTNKGLLVMHFDEDFSV